MCVCVCVGARACICTRVCCERQNNMTAHVETYNMVQEFKYCNNFYYTGFTVTKHLRTVIKPSMRGRRTALHIAVVVMSIII